MIPLFSLLIIIVLSITTIRIGAAALELTGLSEDVATFQAQSAFSGVGYTTTEAEQIVNHPGRRRIIRILILLGSAGISSSIATLILTFIGQSGSRFAVRGAALFGGLVIIFVLARSRAVSRIMRSAIKRALNRLSDIQLYDYEKLLGLSKGYTICRITVKPDGWMEGQTLKEARPNLEGVLVLGIQREAESDLKYIGAPNGETRVLSGDTLI